MNVELDPGQSVEVSLIAMKVTNVVEITYKARLSDRFTIGYNKKYDYNGNNDNHNIWFISIPARSKDIKETIKIDAYGETHITIKDARTNEELQTLPYSPDMETITLSQVEAIAGVD